MWKFDSFKSHCTVIYGMTLVQVKTVWQKHEFDEYLYLMYKKFRFMVNEAVRIGHRPGQDAQ